MKKQKMLAGAGVLAAAGLIAKILSAVYRVPFQNIVGNQGFYVYQQVYPLYGIGMVLALTGWPLFISKVIAEQETIQAQRVIAQRLLVLLSVVGVILFTGLYFGAEYIAQGMSDIRLTAEIQAVAWLFLLIPFLAVGRGYTQGQLDMLPTAFSQVIEQVIRVSWILLIAWYGIQADWSVYRIGTWATFAATLAGVGAMAYLVFHMKPKLLISRTVQANPQLSWKRLAYRLWTEGSLLALLAALLIFLQLVDSFMVKRLLEVIGYTSTQAEYTKGVYDRGQPIVQLGMVVATGIGTALLPNLRVHWLNQKESLVRRNFRLTVRLSLVFSIMAVVGLVAIMPALNTMLFASAEGSGTLSWYVLMILPASLLTVLSSVLQSINQAQGLTWYVGVTIILKVVANSFLIRLMGIDGAALSSVVALLPFLLFVIIKTPKSFFKTGFSGKWFYNVGLVAAGVFISAFLITWLCGLVFGWTRLGSMLTVVVAVLVGLLTFLFMAVKLRIFTEDEWLALPKGAWLKQKIDRGA
ncbi:polysaccharide biosynthesis protein [Weissella halotolerans]|nr:polysaccharide biosynthesis protein [Weissella halotolerans]